jgi:hypothetical protein
VQGGAGGGVGSPRRKEAGHEQRVLGDVRARIEGRPHLIARMPDHELWMAFFRDPDRNLLALMSEVRA